MSRSEKIPFNPGPLALMRGGQMTDLNVLCRPHGLSLSECDCAAIIQARNLCLQNLGRVELGDRPLRMLVSAFSTSPWVIGSEWPDLLCQLVELFYELKNETLDEIPDDELIAQMKEYYDGSCRGSMELLTGRELEGFARRVRFGIGGLVSLDEEEVRE